MTKTGFHYKRIPGTRGFPLSAKKQERGVNLSILAIFSGRVEVSYGWSNVEAKSRQRDRLRCVHVRSWIQKNILAVVLLETISAAGRKGGGGGTTTQLNLI